MIYVATERGQVANYSQRNYSFIQLMISKLMNNISALYSLSYNIDQMFIMLEGCR